MRAGPIVLTPELQSMLPTVATRAFAERAWTGTHGHAGLTASLEFRELVLNGNVADGWAARAVASGTVRDANGEMVGNFLRSAESRSGALQVHHDALDLTTGGREARGTGFGRSYIDQSIAAYPEAGIGSVKLRAATDGRVAWAKLGWEPTGGAPTIRRWIEMAEGAGRLSDEEFEAFEAAPPATVRELLAFGPVAERVLRSTQGWDGVRSLAAELDPVAGAALLQRTGEQARALSRAGDAIGRTIVDFAAIDDALRGGALARPSSAAEVRVDLDTGAIAKGHVTAAGHLTPATGSDGGLVRVNVDLRSGEANGSFVGAMVDSVQQREIVDHVGAALRTGVRIATAPAP